MSMKFGKYTIMALKSKEHEGFDYWIQHEDGEGMATTEEKIEKMIEQFFREEF